MATELYSGTQAVDTTEWSCTTDTAGPDADTTPGTYQLVLDVSDMVAGDTLQIRVYEKCRAGDTQGLLHEWVLSGAQASPIWVSDPPMTLMHGWDFTLDALAGTITVLWSIRSDAGQSVAVATGGIASTSFAAGAIDNAAIAAGALGASEFAALSELSQGIPTATPTLATAVMLMYMALRNASQSTATERRILNDAGTVIAKATMSDNGVTFDQGELVSGA